MMKLGGRYQGFKVGMRLGNEAIALFALDSKLGEATRHALRNVAVSSILEREYCVFSINGVFYAPGRAK